MKSREHKEKSLEGIGGMQAPQSPLDLWRMMGGKAQRVRSKEGKAVDSMLAVYKGRFTYTFIWEEEVASIHYDETKGEIFLKGHNIKHLELSESQIKALRHLDMVLAAEEPKKPIFKGYSATLAKLLADK